MSNFPTFDGCFQKASGFPPNMLQPRQLIFGVILILGISFSPLTHSEFLSPDFDVELSGEDLTQVHHEYAESNWFLASSEDVNGIHLTNLSGDFTIAHGSFNPLAEAPPEVPGTLQNSADFHQTGMKFIQLNNYDYNWLYNLEVEGYISILDILGDGNFHH